MKRINEKMSKVFHFYYRIFAEKIKGGKAENRGCTTQTIERWCGV
ncbi:MAG: hypothetical protein RR397_08940 [Odoribacter sp.]